MQLTLQNFRNFKENSFTFSFPQLITGQNGSGKSTLLEAITVLSTGRSFRSPQLTKLIHSGAKGFTVNLKVTSSLGGADASVGCAWQPQKGMVLSLNGAQGVGQVDVARLLPSILVNQQAFDLIEGGATERRKFFDWLMFHVEPSFYTVWQQCQRILLQRNAALKAHEPVNPWDEAFVEKSNALTALRQQLFVQFKTKIDELLVMLGSIPLSITFYQGWPEDETLKEGLRRRLPLDQKRGFTSIGPHRADLGFRAEEEDARHWLSRGQVKRACFILHLARAQLFELHRGEPPLWLIDDFSAELDEAGQMELLRLLFSKNNPLIVTSLLENTPFRDFFESTIRLS